MRPTTSATTRRPSPRTAGACAPAGRYPPSPSGYSRCTAATSWTRVAAPRAAPRTRPSLSGPAACARSSRRIACRSCSAIAPRLFCDRAATVVGVAHAGWRGLAGGVLEQTVARLDRPARELLAWLGPAIGPQAFEVGDEVRAAFTAQDGEAARCFHPSARGRWLADLYGLARLRLQRAGVGDVHGGGMCTFSDAARFYSYRRDGVTGRMASLLWLEHGPG